MIVSELSGREYRDVSGSDLDSELRTRGHDHSGTGFKNVMTELREGEFLTYTRMTDPWNPSDYQLIRLTTKGRELVEGWPSSAGVSIWQSRGAACCRCLGRRRSQRARRAPEQAEGLRSGSQGRPCRSYDRGVDRLGQEHRGCPVRLSTKALTARPLPSSISALRDGRDRAALVGLFGRCSFDSALRLAH